MITFNKPYLHGMELVYIADAVSSGKISGDGKYTHQCHSFFSERYGFKKTLLTHSCTAALEMAALLLDIQLGDEIIAPSYTFVSTVNAFVLRGAKIVFADSYFEHPNIDPIQIEELITPKTKAIVIVHYAGVACDMDAIIKLANKYNISVVEDAAQSIDAYYLNKPLGSFGRFATFSFHETKNIISGEGGLLCVNESSDAKRAEIIREKGTNRSAFFRGEIDKYGWVDIGSSFLPSDIIAAYLYAQLEFIDAIQSRRRQIWLRYYSNLFSHREHLGISLPIIPGYAQDNSHIFYIICPDLVYRTALIEYLSALGVHAVFHYLSLHTSPYYSQLHDGRTLPNSDRFSDCLLRLPMYYELTDKQVDYICDCIISFIA